MDAFTYFLVELALWNILLATLAFLFGLLMGHWIWASSKKRLFALQEKLRASEEELASIREEEPEKENKEEDMIKHSPKANEVPAQKLPPKKVPSKKNGNRKGKKQSGSTKKSKQAEPPAKKDDQKVSETSHEDKGSERESKDLKTKRVTERRESAKGHIRGKKVPASKRRTK